MKSKIRVGIMFGGKSAEHEVSLQSAKNIYDAINRDIYDVVLIGIDKKGQWHLSDAEKFLQSADNPKLIRLHESTNHLALVPGEKTDQLIQLKDVLFECFELIEQDVGYGISEETKDNVTYKLLKSFK